MTTGSGCPATVSVRIPFGVPELMIQAEQIPGCINMFTHLVTYDLTGKMLVLNPVKSRYKGETQKLETDFDTIPECVSAGYLFSFVFYHSFLSDKLSSACDILE